MFFGFIIVHPSAMRYTSDDAMKFFNPTGILKEVQSKPPVSDFFPNRFPAKRNLAARVCNAFCLLFYPTLMRKMTNT